METMEFRFWGEGFTALGLGILECRAYRLRVGRVGLRLMRFRVGGRVAGLRVRRLFELWPNS